MDDLRVQAVVEHVVRKAVAVEHLRHHHHLHQDAGPSHGPAVSHRRPSDEDVRIPFHQPPLHESGVRLRQVPVVPHGAEAEPPEPADEHGLLAPDEIVRCYPFAHHVAVGRGTVASVLLYLMEYCDCEGLDHGFRRVAEVVADLERDPPVRPGPFHLQVTERGELGLHLVVPVPDTDHREDGLEHLVVHLLILLRFQPQKSILGVLRIKGAPCGHINIRPEPIAENGNGPKRPI